MTDRLGIVIAAGLGQVAAGGDAELDAEMLEQDRHEVGDHDDGEQRVAEFRAARQIGRPVARVHVADRDEKTRAGKGEQLPPERGVRWNEDTAMDFRQRDGSAMSLRQACSLAVNSGTRVAS